LGKKERKKAQNPLNPQLNSCCWIDTSENNMKLLLLLLVLVLLQLIN
jgi:hypothetical protein